MNDDLRRLYDEMYEHTKGECSKCNVPFSCCSDEYCGIAADNARKAGVDLRSTGNTKARFLTSSGCIVPAYLRPLCTMHTCDVNSVGCKPGDQQWTDKYFEIRNKITELEFAIYCKGVDQQGSNT